MIMSKDDERALLVVFRKLVNKNLPELEAHFLEDHDLVTGALAALEWTRLEASFRLRADPVTENLKALVYESDTSRAPLRAELRQRLARLMVFCLLLSNALDGGS